MSSSSTDTGFSSQRLASAQLQLAILQGDDSELSSRGVSSKHASYVVDFPLKDDTFGSSLASSERSKDDLDGQGDKDDEIKANTSLRPNKFKASAATWRSWTAKDRAIATSLDHLRAQDLSVHLYNAHALKGRIRSELVQSNETRDPNNSWEPSMAWTAWPLPVDEVPSVYTETWKDGSTDDKVWRSLKRPQGPRAELEESLAGVALKQAREMFLSRGWDEDPLKSSSLADKPRSKSRNRRNSNCSTLSKNRVQRSEDALEDSRNIMSFEMTDYRKSASDADSEGSGNTTQSSDIDNTQSQYPWSTTHVRKPDRAGRSEASTMKPTLLLDDEKAEQLLQPTIRHLLVKVDELLHGLHTARQAYLAVSDDSQMETTDQSRSASRERSRSSARSRNQSQVRARKKGKKKERPLRSPVERGHDGGAPKGQSTHTENRRLGLRDWSDIIGLAAITGWAPGIVQAAAARCSALFGEGMDFRTLIDAHSEPVETSFLPSRIVGHLVDFSDSDSRPARQRSRESSSPTYPCSSRSISRALYRRQWSPLVRQGNFYCPVPGCREALYGFSRRQNFHRHVQRRHESLNPEKRRDLASEDEMSGDVHVDGFMKPVKASRGWMGRYKRAADVGRDGGSGKGKGAGMTEREVDVNSSSGEQDDADDRDIMQESDDEEEEEEEEEEDDDDDDDDDDEEEE